METVMSEHVNYMLEVDGYQRIDSNANLDHSLLAHAVGEAMWRLGVDCHVTVREIGPRNGRAVATVETPGYRLADR